MSDSQITNKDGTFPQCNLTCLGPKLNMRVFLKCGSLSAVVRVLFELKLSVPVGFDKVSQKTPRGSFLKPVA